MKNLGKLKYFLYKYLFCIQTVYITIFTKITY